MINRLTTSRAVLAAAVVLAGGLSACSEDPVQPEQPKEIVVPATYTFQSRFDASKSSIDYGGQVVRNLLIQDLISTLSGISKAGATAVTEADLLALYEHSDAANLTTKIAISGKTLLETQYNKIATNKKLSDKISPATVVGTGTTADALIRAWLRRAAENSQDPMKLGTPEALFDENGLDIPEMVGKVLFGSVSYYQATSVYLANVMTKDNSVAADDGKGGKLAYTVMEHNWDEAFGYLGAARNYADFTDDQLTTGTEYVRDVNGDGKIDLSSEFNYTIARYAARRDKGAAGTDFTKEIFDAFLKGRATISGLGSAQEVEAQLRKVSTTWEKIMAASAVHYLNAVKKALPSMGGDNFNLVGYRHEWSELKGFLIALQYNSAKMITDAQLTQLHTLVGSAPTVNAAGTSEHTAYVTAIDSAAAILKSAYGFTDAQMSGW